MILLCKINVRLRVYQCNLSVWYRSGYISAWDHHGITLCVTWHRIVRFVWYDSYSVVSWEGVKRVSYLWPISWAIVNAVASPMSSTMLQLLSDSHIPATGASPKFKTNKYCNIRVICINKIPVTDYRLKLNKPKLGFSFCLTIKEL